MFERLHRQAQESQRAGHVEYAKAIDSRVVDWDLKDNVEQPVDKTAANIRRLPTMQFDALHAIVTGGAPATPDGEENASEGDLKN